MYVKRVLARHFRCFERLDVPFLAPGDPPPKAAFDVPTNINVLLGNNGSGKTSVLRAIALASLSSVISNSGYRPAGLVRRDERGLPAKLAAAVTELRLSRDEAERAQNQSASTGVLIEAIGTNERLSSAGQYPFTSRHQIEELGSEIAAAFDDDSLRQGGVLDPYIYDDRWSGFFVVGYGVQRRVEAVESFDASVRKMRRSLRYQRVASLFEEEMTLAPLGSWVPSLTSREHRRVADLIDTLTPGDTRLLDKLEDGEVMFEHHGIRLPFSQLSDGYRAYIGWVADLLSHCHRVAGADLDSVEGVVLVDEIDLHLHPSWQRTVLPLLGRALPKLQFIVTTHSPIIAGTVSSHNLHVFEWEGHGVPRIERPQEEVWGLSADQILTSSAFGLGSTRNDAFLEKLRDVERRRDAHDVDATRRFTRMLALGGAGIDTPPETAVPAWIEELEARPREKQAPRPRKAAAKSAAPSKKKPAKTRAVRAKRSAKAG